MEGYDTARRVLAPRYRIVRLPCFVDHRGSLSVADGSDLPFPVRRFYWLHQLPRGAVRGGHAHRTEEELILALAGSLCVTVDDGRVRQKIVLERADQALYVPALLWHELHDFSPGSVCGVLASQPYQKDDYFTTYEAFVAYLRSRS